MVYVAVYFANHSVSKVFSMRSFWSFLGKASQEATVAFGALLNSFSRFCGRGLSSTSWGEAFFVF